MIDNMDGLRMIRNSFFEVVGKRRITRVAFIALFMAWLWTFADFMSGNLEINLLHDLICVFMAVTFERLLPWGKS